MERSGSSRLLIGRLTSDNFRGGAIAIAEELIIGMMRCLLLGSRENWRRVQGLTIPSKYPEVLCLSNNHGYKSIASELKRSHRPMFGFARNIKHLEKVNEERLEVEVSHQ